MDSELTSEVGTQGERIELQALLQVIRLRHDLDFSQYNLDSIMRRVMRRRELWQLEHISDLIPLVLHSKQHWQVLLAELSISVTAMFRDSVFFKAMLEQLFPILSGKERFKIWHAGCASGEEPYSTAILLHESGLLDNAIIYGTDINVQALNIAREGIYRRENVEQWQKAYQQSGGKNHIDRYFQHGYGNSMVKDFIRNKVVFANHNLAGDGIFTEAELIICRNVLIYFNQDLKKSVLTILLNSLSPQGFIALGENEFILGLHDNRELALFDKVANIYRLSDSNITV